MSMNIVPKEAGKCYRIPLWTARHENLEPNSGPFQDQQVPLITKPLLHPQNILF